eukprot:gene19468-21391_t
MSWVLGDYLIRWGVSMKAVEGFFSPLILTKENRGGKCEVRTTYCFDRKNCGTGIIFREPEDFLSYVSATTDPKLLPGHLKPFGAHTSPEPVEESEIIPDAKTFFDQYVLPSRPIVFRGAAKKFKAYSLWTEDYLVKNYGDLEVKIENKLEKEGYTPQGAKGIGRDTIKEFIKTYHKEAKYIISEMPTPMYQDMMALPCMSCGPVKKRLVEVDLWMSSGSSQSILHKDAFNTMNCLINGTKEWKLVPYKFEKDLYKAHEEVDADGGFSKINVRSVDMEKYPKIATLPYYNVTVHGGDCLFLPKSCYHQVNSLPGFNLAMTILFSRFDYDKPKNFKDCNADTERFTPLTDFDVDWQYPGKGYMTMGYSELFTTKSNLYQFAKSNDLTAKTFLALSLTKTDPFTGTEFDVKYVEKMFGIKRGDVITKSVIKKLTKDQLRKIAIMQQQEFSWNTYNYELYKISPHDIARLLAVLAKDSGDNIVIKKDPFVDGYMKSLYGTKKFGERLFSELAGNDNEATQINKNDVLKNFESAANRYLGDDFLESYDVNAKHAEKEDRGDAYVLVKKNLPKEKNEAFFSELSEFLPGSEEEDDGQGEEQEDQDEEDPDSIAETGRDYEENEEDQDEDDEDKPTKSGSKDEL